MYVVLINECKSCEISNQMFFNVTFSFSKTKDNLFLTDNTVANFPMKSKLETLNLYPSNDYMYE